MEESITDKQVWTRIAITIGSLVGVMVVAKVPRRDTAHEFYQRRGPLLPLRVDPGFPGGLGPLPAGEAPEEDGGGALAEVAV